MVIVETSTKSTKLQSTQDMNVIIAVEILLLLLPEWNYMSKNITGKSVITIQRKCSTP